KKRVKVVNGENKLRVKLTMNQFFLHRNYFVTLPADRWLPQRPETADLWAGRELPEGVQSNSIRIYFSSIPAFADPHQSKYLSKNVTAEFGRPSRVKKRAAPYNLKPLSPTRVTNRHTTPISTPHAAANCPR